MNIGNWKTYIPGIAQDAALMGVGLLGANIISLLATPVLSRIYSPTEFGAFAIFVAMISFLRALSTGRYEMAVPLVGRGDSARCVLQVVLLYLIGFTLVLYAVLLVGGENLNRVLGIPELQPWILAVPIGVAAMSIQDSLKYWFIRRRLFLPLAQAPVIETMVRIGISIAFGLLIGADTAWLLIGMLVAQLVSAAFLLVRSAKTGIVARRGLCSRGRLRRIASYYAQLPAHAMTTTLPNALSTNFLPIALSFFFGVTAAGLLLMVQQLASRPTAFAVTAFWNVSYGRLAEMKPNDRRLYLMKLHLAACFFIAIPMSGITAFADLAGIFLGEQWAGIGTILPAFAIMVFFNSVSNLTSFFTVFERYRDESLWNVLLMVSRVGVAALFGFFVADEAYALIGFAAASSILYLSINVYWGLRIKALSVFAYNFVTNFIFIYSASLIIMIFVEDLAERALLFSAFVVVHIILFFHMRGKISRLGYDTREANTAALVTGTGIVGSCKVL